MRLRAFRRIGYTCTLPARADTRVLTFFTPTAYAYLGSWDVVDGSPGGAVLGHYVVGSQATSCTPAGSSCCLMSVHCSDSASCFEVGEPAAFSCAVPCEANQDCGVGTSCDLVSGSPTYGTCQAGGCSTGGTACDPGFACVADACVRTPSTEVEYDDVPCETTSDCSPGYLCVRWSTDDDDVLDATCILPCWNGDHDCPDETICRDTTSGCFIDHE